MHETTVTYNPTQIQATRHLCCSKGSSAHLAGAGSACRAHNAGATTCSSGFWGLHARQVHEEVPKLRHVDIFSAGDVLAFSVLDEIPEPHWIKEPHGAFRTELLPRFFRLCEPPIGVSVAVKTFASKRAGSLALLKVFTSFFPEKQKENNQGGGRI